jgi:hypothetical protein
MASSTFHSLNHLYSIVKIACQKNEIFQKILYATFCSLKEIIFLKISTFLKIILFGGGSSIHAKVVQNMNRSYSNFSHHLGQKRYKNYNHLNKNRAVGRIVGRIVF